jgi:taurine dioxygenase
LIAAPFGATSMQILPLHREFGAEIRGCNCAADLTAGAVATLRDALDRFQVLVLRGDAPLAPERQVAIAGLFGTPVDNGDGRLWSVLQNEEPAGAIKLPFHADFSYTDAPIKVITLHALELPPRGTSTSFVSNVASWASLPDDLRGVLAPLTVRHRHKSSVGMDWPEFIAVHPLCKPHPRTGKPMLFATEHHADRIMELDPGASTVLLARIFNHIYSDEHVYMHHWQPHDLVIWDNLASQHARRETADLADGRRVVRRVVINDVAFPELIARARQQAAVRQSASTLQQSLRN